MNMKPTILHNIWHTIVPRLGLRAKHQQGMRALAYRLIFSEDPLSHTLKQIREIIENSRNLLRDIQSQPSITKRSVIIWTVRGGLLVNVTEAIFAYALRLRGIEVRIVLCDEFLPACEQRAAYMYPKEEWNAKRDRQICEHCHFNAIQVFNALELPVIMLSDLVTDREVATIEERTSLMSVEEAVGLKDGEIQLGDEIRAFLNLYHRTLAWPNSPEMECMARRAAASSLMLYRASHRILDRERPHAILTSHGVYLLWGIIKRVAQQRGIPVTIWGNGWRTDTLRFSSDNWYESAITEPAETWEGLELGSERRQRLDEYLSHRWDGQRDRRVFFCGQGDTSNLTLSDLGLDPVKPTLGIFPNVAWDADIAFKNVVFKDIFDWLLKTVEFFVSNPQFQVIVRSHPGEAISFTSQRIYDLIMGYFRNLPKNVVVIRAEDKVNSYGLSGLLKAAAVYGSQFGLELACRGAPVIIASECFYKGKGFTLDTKTPEEYFELLGRLDRIQPLKDSAISRARTYAYHYYFRRLVPFPYLVSWDWHNLKEIALKSLDELVPGRDKCLDLIVDGILENKAILLDI